MVELKCCRYLGSHLLATNVEPKYHALATYEESLWNMHTNAATKLLRPAWVFFGFVFISVMVHEVYSLRNMELPGTADLLSQVAFFWLIWWWLRDDSNRFDSAYALDLGLFLMLAWIFLVPYHLFKTRWPERVSADTFLYFGHSVRHDGGCDGLHLPNAI